MRLSLSLVILIAMATLWYLFLDRAVAWWTRSDPDAPWHLLSMCIGCTVALILVAAIVVSTLVPTPMTP